MSKQLRLGKVGMLVASGLVAASLLFGCKKPAPEPTCKARDGTVRFWLAGAEKDVPKGATQITPLHDLKGKTQFVTFNLQDPENRYETAPLEELIEEDKNKVPTCEELDAVSKRILHKINNENR